MQWVSLILSFFFGKLNSRQPSFKDSALAIFDEVTLKSRKPVTLVLGALACVLILCGGLFLSVIDLANQYDREGLLRFTASFGTGLFLVAFSGGIFLWIFRFAWPGAHEHHKAHEEIPVKTHQAGALEQALATLVMDFVKERELRREERENPAPHTPATAAHSSSEPVADYRH